ncbi:MAG: hypothetical protein Kow0070_30080 [Anaerolineales bacterium]
MSGTRSGAIEVLYDANNDLVQVWTYDLTNGWVKHGTDISVTFNSGDQFGARAKSNGDVEVYKNGTLLGTRSAASWPYANSGGYIGLWFVDTANALLDDFGGGNVSGMERLPQNGPSFQFASYHPPALRLPKR